MADIEPLEDARKLRALIESEADLVEEHSTMSPAIVDALAEAGLFRLLVPRELGGIEADVGTILDVCEELSFADGSVGWAFAQNTTTMGYAAYLAPEPARKLARAKAAAGMFAPLGVAHKEEGGYRVSGSFQFGSGCGHAEYMGGATMVMVNGEMPPFVDGLPALRGFILPADRVSIQRNWDVMGLRGTGSFDFDVPEQHVDEGSTFSVFETRPVTGGAIYGIGPIPLGTIGSVAWALGVAERALHEIVEIAVGGRTRLGSLPLREQEGFQRDLGVHTLALDAARRLARESYGSAVDAIERGESADVCASRVRETKAAASYVTRVAKEAVTFAYEASGSRGLRNPSLLQRCFRDIYVGCAHQVFDDRNYRESVKPRLGLDPAPF